MYAVVHWPNPLTLSLRSLFLQLQIKLLTNLKTAPLRVSLSTKRASLSKSMPILEVSCIQWMATLRVQKLRPSLHLRYLWRDVPASELPLIFWGLCCNCVTIWFIPLFPRWCLNKSAQRSDLCIFFSQLKEWHWSSASPGFLLCQGALRLFITNKVSSGLKVSSRRVAFFPRKLHKELISWIQTFKYWILFVFLHWWDHLLIFFGRRIFNVGEGILQIRTYNKALGCGMR